jgi:hypothetical protein
MKKPKKKHGYLAKKIKNTPQHEEMQKIDSLKNKQGFSSA